MCEVNLMRKYCILLFLGFLINNLNADKHGGSRMNKISSELFGDIYFNDFTQEAFVIYNGQKIYIDLYDVLNDLDKMNVCLKIIDQYFDIYKISKKLIVDNFYDEIVNFYFSSFFNESEFDDELLLKLFDTTNFNDININNIMENMKFPDLGFETYDEKLYIILSYNISEKYSDHNLGIIFDEESSLIGFRIDG
jgi:hypothetical protein